MDKNKFELIIGNCVYIRQMDRSMATLSLPPVTSADIILGPLCTPWKNP
jgi:hypothetical protein